MASLLTSYQTHTFTLSIPIRNPTKPHHILPKSQPTRNDNDAGIPSDDVKLIAKFKSRHNYIRVLQVSRRADHPFAGSHLLLLDQPGNIHSINFLSQTILTQTYFDVFATFPAILPGGPVGLLGLGAGSAVRPILKLYPNVTLHCWEIDPAVLAVGREYFGLGKSEKEFRGRLFVHVGDAFKAEARNGFAGLIVDLFSKGSLVPPLQEVETWRVLRRCLRKGGRVMVNVGGSCVESEESGRDGRVVMQETLVAMSRVFGEKVFVLSLGNGKDDSSVALTGDLPDLEEWKKKLPRSFKGYVDMWKPFRG